MAEFVAAVVAAGVAVASVPCVRLWLAWLLPLHQAAAQTLSALKDIQGTTSSHSDQVLLSKQLNYEWNILGSYST